MHKEGSPISERNVLSDMLNNNHIFSFILKPYHMLLDIVDSLIIPFLLCFMKLRKIFNRSFDSFEIPIIIIIKLFGVALRFCYYLFSLWMVLWMV